tara:strand:- start:2161 stop:2814 length:654 start_codon:yes stop_codon:yes gene_type:complete
MSAAPSIFDELNRRWWGDAEVLDDMLILQEIKEMHKEDLRIELPNVEEWCVVKTKKRQQKVSHTKKSKQNTSDKKALKTKNNKPKNSKPTNNKPKNNKPKNNKPTNRPTNNKPKSNNKRNVNTSDTKEVDSENSKNKRTNSKNSQITKYGTVTNVVKGGCVFIKSDDASNTGSFVCPEIKKIKIGDKVQFRTSKDTDTQHFQKALNVRLIKDKNCKT